jgi:hypothetical protein
MMVEMRERAEMKSPAEKPNDILVLSGKKLRKDIDGLVLMH